MSSKNVARTAFSLEDAQTAAHGQHEFDHTFEFLVPFLVCRLNETVEVKRNANTLKMMAITWKSLKDGMHIMWKAREQPGNLGAIWPKGKEDYGHLDGAIDELIDGLIASRK